MSPSNGAAPYVLSIAFDNKSMVDGVNYVFEARMHGASGFCASTPLTTQVQTTASAELLGIGTFSNNVTVPAGVCRVWDARIVRVSDGEIISYRSVNISNL